MNYRSVWHSTELYSYCFDINTDSKRLRMSIESVTVLPSWPCIWIHPTSSNRSPPSSFKRESWTRERRLIYTVITSITATTTKLVSRLEFLKIILYHWKNRMVVNHLDPRLQGAQSVSRQLMKLRSERWDFQNSALRIYTCTGWDGYSSNCLPFDIAGLPSILCVHI